MSNVKVKKVQFPLPINYNDFTEEASYAASWWVNGDITNCQNQNEGCLICNPFSIVKGDTCGPLQEYIQNGGISTNQEGEITYKWVQLKNGDWKFLTFHSNHNYANNSAPQSKCKLVLNEEDGRAAGVDNYKGGYGIFYLKLISLPGMNNMKSNACLWNSIWLQNIDTTTQGQPGALWRGLELDFIETMKYWQDTPKFSTHDWKNTGSADEYTGPGTGGGCINSASEYQGNYGTYLYGVSGEPGSCPGFLSDIKNPTGPHPDRWDPWPPKGFFWAVMITKIDKKIITAYGIFKNENDIPLGISENDFYTFKNNAVFFTSNYNSKKPIVNANDDTLKSGYMFNITSVLHLSDVASDPAQVEVLRKNFKKASEEDDLKFTISNVNQIYAVPDPDPVSYKRLITESNLSKSHRQKEYFGNVSTNNNSKNLIVIVSLILSILFIILILIRMYLS